MASSVSRCHGQLSLCKILEKTNDPILKKIQWEMDGWTNRQTDRHADKSAFVGQSLTLSIQWHKRFLNTILFLATIQVCTFHFHSDNLFPNPHPFLKYYCIEVSTPYVSVWRNFEVFKHIKVGIRLCESVFCEGAIIL